jgi:drug/metabolite transporter (DMT)-like permease
MTRFRANLLLMLAAIIWGSSFVVQQIGTGNLGTISFTGARFLVGACIVFPFAFRQFRRVHFLERRFQKMDWLTLVLTGTVLLTAAVLQQHGILRTTVTNSGFLTALYVPLVPFLGFVFLRRKVHFVVWPASICCFIGTYIMSGAHEVKLVDGDFWVISSTVFWATHVMLVGALASKTTAPLVVAATQFAVCGFLGLFLGAIVESPVFADFIGAVWGVCYIGIFSVGMAFTLQVVGQRYTPAADAAIILSSETVFAAIGGMVFLGERLTVLQFFGGALIFISIIAVEVLPQIGAGKARALN